MYKKIIISLLLNIVIFNIKCDLNDDLATAIWTKNFELARDLIAQGADINFKYSSGWTPLHVNVQYGFKDRVKLLLKLGASVNIKDDHGKTPLYLTANHVSMDEANDLENLKLLINHAAEVNSPDSDGRTPLHAAAYFGRKELTKLLLELGADVSIKDNNEQTAADLASDPQIKALINSYENTISEIKR